MQAPQQEHHESSSAWRIPHFWTDVLPFLWHTVLFLCCSLLGGLCGSDFLFKIPQRTLTGFKSGFLLWKLLCDPGTVLWIIIMLHTPLLQSFCRLGVIFDSQYYGISTAFMVLLIDGVFYLMLHRRLLTSVVYPRSSNFMFSLTAAFYHL